MAVDVGQWAVCGACVPRSHGTVKVKVVPAAGTSFTTNNRNKMSPDNRRL